MQTSDIIALLALSISILSLWLQNSGSQKQIMLSNFLEYTQRYQEIISHFPKDVINQNFDITSMPENEQESLLRYMWMYFDLCYEEYQLHKLGFINSNLWKFWDIGMKSAFSRPAFQQSWYLIRDKTKYEPDLDFVKFVESSFKSQRNHIRRK